MLRRRNAEGTAGLIEAEIKAAEKHGITIRYNARAVSLLQGRKGIEGVRIIEDRVEEDIGARAVVLAAGGFESNRECDTEAACAIGMAGLGRQNHPTSA